MKTFISIIAGLFMSWLIVFKFDLFIVNSIMSLVPEGDWFAFIKLVVWVVVLCFTLGLTIWISFGFGALVAGMLKGFK